MARLVLLSAFWPVLLDSVVATSADFALEALVRGLGAAGAATPELRSQPQQEARVAYDSDAHETP